MSRRWTLLRAGSFLATFLISEATSLIRLIAGCDFHPQACRRKRARKVVVRVLG